MAKPGFDHMAAIIDDRRRAIRLLMRVIEELELAEAPAIVAQLQATLRALREMTPGGDRPSRKYGAAKIGAANDLANALNFGKRIGRTIRGG